MMNSLFGGRMDLMASYLLAAAASVPATTTPTGRQKSADGSRAARKVASSANWGDPLRAEREAHNKAVDAKKAAKREKQQAQKFERKLRKSMR